MVSVLLAIVAAVSVAASASPAFGADMAEVAKPRLGFHLFGSDSRGEPLSDDVLASDAVDLGDCIDLRASVARIKEATKAASRRAVAPVIAETKDGFVSDRDLWLRLKFGCVLRDALGRYKEWRKTDRRPLEFVLMFNGGLNTQRDVTNLARDNYKRILSERRYPIFMIWPTGGLDAYGESLLEVRSAESFTPKTPVDLLTAATQAISDGLRGVAGLPKTYENGVRYNEGFKPLPRVDLATRDRRVKTGEMATPKQNVSHSDTVDEGGFELPVTPLSVARPATSALSDIGLVAWSNMVRRTRTSVHTVGEFPGQGSARRFDFAVGGDRPADCSRALAGDSEKLRTCFPSGAGVFSRFFHWYRACAKPSLSPRLSDVCPVETLTSDDYDILKAARFTLIGHSMGSIVINELVSAYPTMPFGDIVFMAGADSVRSTRKTLGPLLVDNGGCTRFYNLMLHPQNDANEQMALGALPRGSLLEYVDHYLDPPKSLDDRTVGKWINVLTTKHMFAPEAQKWMLFQVFDRTARESVLKTKAPAKDALQDPLFGSSGGRVLPISERSASATPKVHGGFNDPGVWFWSRSFWNPEKAVLPPREASCEKVFFRPK